MNDNDPVLEAFLRLYYRSRSRYGRIRRLIFPSPLELEFVELMGGRVARVRWLKDPTRHYPAALIISKGDWLGGEGMKREVRYGRYYVDFANDLDRIIEIDGREFHMDVVADLDREIYIKARAPDARLLRIKGHEIRRQPAVVEAKVKQFLSF